MDEAFIGGRYRWMHYDRCLRRPEKTIVLGLYQRGGPIQTVVVPDRDKLTLHKQGKSTVCTWIKAFHR